MADVSNLKQNDNDIKRAECRYVYDLDDSRERKQRCENDNHNDEMSLMISITITWEVEEENIA